MTPKELQKLQDAGTIKGFFVKAKSNLPAKKPKGEDAKAWVHDYLLDLCQAERWHLWVEPCLVPGRKFRADWAIPDIRVCIEYEGVNSAKSRHTSITGYTTDCEKYTLTQAERWRIIRLTIINYKKLPEYLDKFLTPTF